MFVLIIRKNYSFICRSLLLPVELCTSGVTLCRAAEQLLLGDNSICTLRNVVAVKELIKYSVNQVDNHP